MHVRRQLPRRAALLTVSVVTAGLLLAGCGADDPEPKFEAEPSPSTSVSPSPGPSATPASDSPEALIRRWVEELNAAQVDGHVDAYLALSRCGACVTFANRVKGVYDSGGYIKTDGWTIRSISSMGRSGKSAAYKLRILSAPSEMRETSKASVQHLEGGPRTLQVLLIRRNGAWHLDDFLDMGR